MPPANPAFSLPSCPHPPSPLPLRGRGSPKVYFAGGFAPGTPALNRLRHVQTVPNRYPAGGLPSLSPVTPAFRLLYAPIPPDPLPLRGRGSPKVYFAGGFAPGTPALNRLRHLQTVPNRYPAGGLLSLSPATPAFRLPSCPHPPDPLPLRGRGSPKVYFAGGFAPGTPALNRLRHVQTVPNRYPETEPGRRHSQGTASCRFAANRGFNPGDARGEAPCMRKLKIPPSPEGKSALRARAGGDILPLRGRGA